METEVRMRSGPIFQLFSLLVVSFLPASALAQEAATAPPPGVKAVLELSGQFFYAGDPLPVRISVGNDGEESVVNPIRTTVFGGLRARTGDGAALKRADSPTGQEPERPEKLPPGTFYGAIVDITSVYPGLAQPGSYEIEWSGDGVRSRTLIIRVIPKYDPAKLYRAQIDTEEGPIYIDFFQDVSPIAVKAFIDMANAGFYDGLLFHEVHSGGRVVAGDPRFGKAKAGSITYPQEQSDLPPVAGTVLMMPAGAAPPSNGSAFMILLRPEPSIRGQATILGQVVKGLDAVMQISQRPSTQRTSEPFFKPLKDIEIRGITIGERPKRAP